MTIPTSLWRATLAVVLTLLLAPWATAQDARMTRSEPSLAPTVVKPLIAGMDDARMAGPIDVLRAGGPDGFGYRFKDSAEPGGPVFETLDISGTGTAATMLQLPGCAVGTEDPGDGGYATVALPFSFPFYGTNYTSVNLHANGFLNFGALPTACSFSNASMPNAASPNGVVAPFWDDLDDGAAGQIFTHTLGDGRFVVQYNRVIRWNTTTELTFQVILSSDGSIVFQYVNLTTALLTSATTGIENVAGNTGLQANFNAAYLANGLAIKYEIGPPPPPDAAFASTTLQFQNTGTAGPLVGGRESWVVAANVQISGTAGTVPMTSITFNTTGTTNVADLSRARLLYSGSSTTFNYDTTPEFGSPILSPNGAMTFNGSLNLPIGPNYFILVYQATPTAPSAGGNVADATYTESTVNGVVRTPTATTLTGTLPIVAAPVNDNLAAAIVVGATPYSTTGTNVGGSAEANEFLPTCGNGTTASAASVWWKYTPGADGLATFDLLGSGFDTVLSVWTGTGFPLTHVACNDDRAGGGATSLISDLPVTGGTTYYLRVGGWNNAQGAIALSVTGPTPAVPTYTVTAPAAGEIIRAGYKVVARWSGPGVPNGTDFVNVYLRKGTGPELLIGSGKNNGKAKVTIPAGTVSGSDYTIVVRRQADATVYGTSAAFGISNAAEQYVVTEPDPAEYWRRGSTKTILWTTPGTAPASTVTVRLYRGSTVVATYPGEPDDGSLDLALAANLQINTNYSVRITNDADPVFYGNSLRFAISRFEVTDPAEGASWAAGSSQVVNWTTGGAAGGIIRVSLRRRSVGGGQSLAINVPYTNLTRTVTIPAGAVPANDYFIQLTYTQGETSYVVNSNTFSVTGAAQAPPVEARHFASPEPVAYASETMVVVRGLAEGTEVGAFAGDVLLASARVEGGEAHLAVSDEVVVDGEEWAFAPDAVLSLRAFADGVETSVEARSVVLGSDGSSVEAVRLSGGDVLVIDAGLSSVTAGASSSAFAVAGVVPNPTSGAATVRFTLPEAQSVRVVVYDVLGREVSTVYDGTGAAGVNEASVPSSLDAGVYVVRVTSGASSVTTRFTVVR